MRALPLQRLQLVGRHQNVPSQRPSRWRQQRRRRQRNGRHLRGGRLVVQHREAHLLRQLLLRGAQQPTVLATQKNEDNQVS